MRKGDRVVVTRAEWMFATGVITGIIPKGVNPERFDVTFDDPGRNGWCSFDFFASEIELEK